VNLFRELLGKENELLEETKDGESTLIVFCISEEARW